MKMTSALWAKALTLALLTLGAANSQAKDNGGSISVSPVSQDADAANGGMVYALPKTVLRVTLTARAIVETAGPYYQYSTRLLNLTNVVTENATHWTLIAADVQTVGQADYSKRFKIVARDGAQLPSLDLTQDGVLQVVNGIGSSDASAADGAAQKTVAYADFSGVPLSQSTLSRTSKAAMAEDVAQSIYALREARLSLISGDKEASLPDVGSFLEALRRIDNMEHQMVELFAGRRDTVIVTKVVDIVPDYNGESSIIPVRFSGTDGFVDALDLTGKPVYVDLEFSDANKLNSIPEGSKARKSSPLSGLRYCVPSCLSVRVLDRNILLCQKSVLCSQGGQVAELPAAMLQTHVICLDSATGAIRSVSQIAK